MAFSGAWVRHLHTHWSRKTVVSWRQPFSDSGRRIRRKTGRARQTI